MGLFNKLISIFTGSRGPAPQPTSSPRESEFTVTFTGSAGPSVHVSDREVAEHVSQHADGLAHDPLQLKTAAPPMSPRRESSILSLLRVRQGPALKFRTASSPSACNRTITC